MTTINFHGAVGKVINQSISRFDESSRGESKTDSITVKLTCSQKEIVKDICLDDDIGVSTFAANAISCYIPFRQYKEKLIRHEALIVSLLESLP
jgi:hypothetical protein